MQIHNRDHLLLERRRRKRFIALESARAISEGIRKRRHGKPITKSVKILEKVRDERTAESSVLLQRRKVRS
jgi:hypothetical protein